MRDSQDINGYQHHLDRLNRWFYKIALLTFTIKIVGWFLFPRVLGMASKILAIVILFPLTIYYCVQSIKIAQSSGQVVVPFAFGVSTAKKIEEPTLFALYVATFWLELLASPFVAVGIAIGIFEFQRSTHVRWASLRSSP